MAGRGIGDDDRAERARLSDRRSSSPPTPPVADETDEFEGGGFGTPLVPNPTGVAAETLVAGVQFAVDVPAADGSA